jgi:putative CRISPR-associated protein (TIGR02619 family)
MKNLIISTVGTSLITNGATDEEKTLLYNYSNDTSEECPKEVKELITNQFARVSKKLSDSDNHTIRKVSAELNGIYGIYNENINARRYDLHFLISTNTYQGIKSAEVIKKFLQTHEIVCEIITPKKLSTKNKTDFSEGIKELLKWFDETLDGYKQSGYKIIFNLTGGFKSLQGYLNTIAMFYADKIIYIFESANELIEIPRLPIQIDYTPFNINKDKLLLLNASKIFDIKDFTDFPETIFDSIDNKVILSVWGEVMWNKVKYDLFDKLPELPYIKFHNNFIELFNKKVDKKFKIKLLESIAKVSVILENSNGNLSELSKGGLQFSPLESKKFEKEQLYHFRLDLDIRVNCIKRGNNLLLTGFGTHDQTQK